MCAAAAFGGLSAAADEPLRAQKPAVDRDYQWSVTFEKNVAVIRAEADAPEGIVATTIEALKNAGHKKFAIKQFVTPEETPRRDTSWIQIRVRNQEAEIALSRDLPYKTVVEVIEHLQKCDVKTIRFAPPQKSK
jgi:biopolymer transport protein ExbD